MGKIIQTSGHRRTKDKVGYVVSYDKNYCLGCIYLCVQDSGLICDVDNQCLLITADHVSQCKKSGWRWRRVRYSVYHSRTTGEWAEFLEKYR